MHLDICVRNTSTYIGRSIKMPALNHKCIHTHVVPSECRDNYLNIPNFVSLQTDRQMELEKSPWPPCATWQYCEQDTNLQASMAVPKASCFVT
jgi:hypothetical protein